MNVLLVGTDKRPLLEHLPERFLIIDDGDLIDALPLPKRRKITYLDLSTHSFNPLKGIDYKRARELISMLDAVFPEGANTLTKKSSNFVLLNALLSHPKSFETLIPVPDKNDTGVLDAYQKIQTLLLSPVLNAFLCNPTNFSFNGILIARLDRRVLSEFDCFVIANLLISNYKGHVIVPDFGFYGCPFHTSLIRQNRLIAGVNFLDEAKGMLNNLLLIEKKIVSKCTADDAEVLADYCSGFPRGTQGYSEYVARSIDSQ